MLIPLVEIVAAVTNGFHHSEGNTTTQCKAFVAVVKMRFLETDARCYFSQL
jgi:hypothetical protein